MPGAWDRESEAQLTYFCNPADAYDARVRGGKCLAELQQVILRVGKSKDGSGLLHARPGTFLFVPFWAEDPCVLQLGGPTCIRSIPGDPGDMTPVAAEACTPVPASNSSDDAPGPPDIDMRSASSAGSARISMDVDLDCSHGSLKSDGRSEPEPETIAKKTVATQLAEWGCKAAATAMQAILLPEPICDLLLCGKWQHILLLTRCYAIANCSAASVAASVANAAYACCC